VRALALVSFVMTSTLLLAGGCKKGETSGTGGTTASTGGQGGQGAASTGGGGSGGTVCHPEVEICDGKDNDCNGFPDDVPDLPTGCHCDDGSTQTCYTGPDGTADVGECKKGTQSCVNGSWGECVGQIKPAQEQCNLLDEDCNGTVDDMGVATCGVGECATALQKCVNGALQPCIPGQPTVEVCDGKDNNCNGKVDESDPMDGSNCLTGLFAACEIGKFACTAGAPECIPDNPPEPEACDGIDNDCDGTTDNNVPGTGAACVTGQPGPCSVGTVSCQNNLIDCFPVNPAVPEVCNDNIDNDCNGVVDDVPGLGGPCDTGLLGACQTGTLVCQGNATNCQQTVFAEASDPCDGIDNDCNGVTDPGCLNTFSGIQENVPIATLVGWTQCYVDTFANSSTPLTTILAQCNKANLLIGCRVTGSSTLQLAAHAPRADVIFDTGTGNITHNANGVGWYYNNSWSWGFVLAGDPVFRNSCDTGGAPNNNLRMCWHTGGGFINGGYRCGADSGLNGDFSHERLVFHAD